jgi:hypothetical protein
MLKSLLNFFSPQVEAVEVVEVVEVVEEEEEVVANPGPEKITEDMIADSLEPFKSYMSNMLRRKRVNDSRKHEAGERVMGAAYKLFAWLADPGLSLGRGLMFGNLLSYYILIIDSTLTIICEAGSWTANSVLAACFWNPDLIVDFVDRGLVILRGYKAATVLSYLVQIRKLVVWRQKQAQWDQNDVLKSSSYEVDIFVTISELKVISHSLSSPHTHIYIHTHTHTHA